MKIPPLKLRRGVALLSVLAILVLITALIVGLLMRAGVERAATVSYSASASAQSLAETAVNLVQLQINEATTQPDSAWASQPGAIRTFATSGQLIYRLYSAATLTTDSASSLAEDVPPEDWPDLKANWVDLNAPVAAAGLNDSAGDALRVFPILDPRDPADPSKIATLGGGFSITDAPGASTTQPAPMPVRWLYVLRNGNLVAPTGTGTSVTVPGAKKSADPTEDNPIIGRIAFWTDDETTKVNINTAADGTFWDVPRFGASDDIQQFAKNQPAAGEYQRYPGHPATTSLRPILASLGFASPTTADGTTSELFKLLPRYNDDHGSKQATRIPSAPPTAKSQRLYPSIGELLYSSVSAGDRTPSSLQRQQVETAKFFLTAKSRAPEVTLFGTPRVSIWPIDQSLATNPSSSRTTPFDRLSAFASTLGEDQFLFHFQRANADSPTSDYDSIGRNQQLYAYLQNLSNRNIPGFGGNFLAKYGSDRDQILTEMVDYIRLTNLYDATLDATGTKKYEFTDKNAGHGQSAPLRIGNTQGFGRFYSISEIGVLAICTADGSGPAFDANGAANDPRSVSNLAAPAFLKNSAGQEVDTNYLTGSPPSGTRFSANPTLAEKSGGARTALTTGQRRLQAMLVFELSCPMAGYTALSPAAEIRVSGLNNLRIAGQSPFPSDSDGAMTLASSSISTTSMTGGVVGMRFAVALGNNNNRLNGWSNRGNTNAYPFVSDPFTVTGESISLSASNPILIEILLKSAGSPSSVVQTYSVQLPSTSMPVPKLLRYGVPMKADAQGNTFPNVASDWWGFDKRIPWASEATRVNFGVLEEVGAVIRSDVVPSRSASETWQLNKSGIQVTGNKAETCSESNVDTDVVRTILAKAGDYRLTAVRAQVNCDPDAADAIFQKHPLYDSSTARFAHTFTEVRDSHRFTGVDLTSNALVTGANLRPRDRADVPGDVTDFSFTGDWDTGLPLIADGAYANKPDEGNILYLATDPTRIPYYTSDNELYADSSFFTPNRIIPSAVMFGSLPSKAMAGVPWRTLLFRPSLTHPDSGSNPRDHLWLDLFTMPVVEPYAISEPFSTAGKINMNYRIVPFGYITRATGVRAVLNGEKMAEVSATDQLYKTSVDSLGSVRTSLNLSDTDGSLRQFEERFDSGDVFRSPSEICDIYLTPQGRAWTTNAQADAAWYGPDFALVGDNVRERVYAHIYPRLTTKSNSFTVHYTVQALKNPSANPETWNERTGVILSQLRGSTAIERYLPPDSPSVPDYATEANPGSIDRHYRWRILENRQFAP